MAVIALLVWKTKFKNKDANEIPKGTEMAGGIYTESPLSKSEGAETEGFHRL